MFKSIRKVHFMLPNEDNLYCLYMKNKVKNLHPIGYPGISKATAPSRQIIL